MGVPDHISFGLKQLVKGFGIEVCNQQATQSLVIVIGKIKLVQEC